MIDLRKVTLRRFVRVIIGAGRGGTGRTASSGTAGRRVAILVQYLTPMRPEDGGEAPQEEALEEGEEGAELLAGGGVAQVVPILGVAEIYEEQQKEELAGRHDAAHEEADGDAGVEPPHDHGTADAQPDDDYGGPKGREGFGAGPSRYRPERREGDDEGEGQDGVPPSGD